MAGSTGPVPILTGLMPWGPAILDLDIFRISRQIEFPPCFSHSRPRFLLPFNETQTKVQSLNKFHLIVYVIQLPCVGYHLGKGFQDTKVTSNKGVCQSMVSTHVCVYFFYIRNAPLLSKLPQNPLMNINTVNLTDYANVEASLGQTSQLTASH